MKKIFNLLLAMLTVCGIACSPEQNEEALDNTTKFTINVSEITSTSAVMNVEASDISVYFLFDIVSKDRFNTYATPAEFANASIEKVKAKANEKGVAFVDALTLGAGTLECTELKGGTEYYAYAFGLTADGALTTDVTLESFTTEPWASDNTFTMEVYSIELNGATVKINAANSDESFYWDLIEKKQYDEYDSENIACLILEELKKECESNGKSLSSQLTKKKVHWSFAGQLTPDTEYCVFVFGVSNSGEVTTDITVESFKTMSVEEASAGIDNGDTNIEGIAKGQYKNLGDKFNVGAARWWIGMDTQDYKGSLRIEVMADLAATELPLGEFPISSSLEAGTAVAGDLDEDYIEYGTIWKHYAADWSTDEHVFMKSGTVTIGKSGDEFTISINAIDGHGNTVTMSYTGALENNTSN